MDTDQPRRSIRIPATIAAVLAVVWMLHKTAIHVLRVPAACDLPCRWDKKTEYGRCEPATAHLEVKVTDSPRVGQIAWYQASLTNNACESLILPKAAYDFFFWDKDQTASIDAGIGAFVAVFDQAGKPLSPEPDSGDGSESGIHPYSIDAGELLGFHRVLFDEDRVLLPPGHTIHTSIDQLKPYREALKDIRTADSIVTAIVPVPVEIPDAGKRYASPPPGFRRLEEYRLHRRGRFSARLIVNSEVWVSPHFSHENYPGWLNSILWFVATGKTAGSHRMGSAKIKISSAPVFFVIEK